MKELFYLNKFFVKYKTRFIVGIVFVICTNIFKVLSPQVLGYAINLVAENLTLSKSFTGFELKELLTQAIYSNILVFSLAYFCIALLSGFFTFLMRQSIIVMSRLIENDLRNEIYAHYQLLDQAFYKRSNTGDLMNKATEDVSKVRMYLGPAVMYSINVFMLFSFVIYSMLKIDVKFTLWVLLPMPVLILCIYKVQSLINVRSRKIQERLSDLTTHAQEFYSGIRVLKSFVQEKLAVQFYQKQSDNYMTESLRMAKIEAFFFPLMILLIGLSTVLVVYIGGIKLNQGAINPGNILEYIFYVNMLTWPISSIGVIATIIQTAAASQKRINEFLKTKPSIESQGEAQADFNQSLTFEKVSFTYPDTGIQAIKNMSFSIPSGEKWAIMGKTGSGKSTLAELIARLYDVNTGHIKFGAADIKKLTLEEYREKIGYVPQDVFLFSDTIANNIKFSNTQLNLEDIIKAAKKASVHDEIMKFPKRYDTLVGERGITLSGGQKQRIAMARVLIKQPEFFILDDALSALDTKTEMSILKNLNQTFNKKTVLVITHRIPSYLHFDKIMVIENGEISEFGTHEDLLRLKKQYFSIYQKQKKY